MRKFKGLSAAIAVVITIVVLLIIALAVIGVSTGAIGKLGGVISHTPGEEEISSTVCSSQITQELCEKFENCEWVDGKCVPRE